MKAKLPDEKLEKFAHKINETARYRIGYPVTQEPILEDFYKWLIESGVARAMSNNVGDPFNAEDHLINSFEIEREVIAFIAGMLEIDDFWGILTSGGTAGNNHGIYFGHAMLKKYGKPLMYVSEQSHYSNERLADLQNIELRIIKCDKMGNMSAKDFEKNLDPTRPALVVYSLGTTFKGAIDDQKALNAVIESKGVKHVYRHVDAALFGGYLMFDKHEELTSKKILNYDSIAISGHKFFGLDEPAGIFITTKSVLNEQNPFHIPYLNGKMPMIDCSRSGLAPLKLYWIINHYGVNGFKTMVKQIMENTIYLKSSLDDIGYPAWVGEHSNTVFFRRPSTHVMHKYHLAPEYDDDFGGDLAHVVVMQHVSKDLIDEFVGDIKVEF